MTGGARATWGGEQRKIAKSQPSFGNIRLSSKRLEAIVPQTRELLISTSYSADQIFANDLTRRMELGIDFGGMFGKGGEFQPLGILPTKKLNISTQKQLAIRTWQTPTARLQPIFRSISALKFWPRMLTTRNWDGSSILCWKAT